MVAAGISDDAASAFFVRERCNLVISTAQFEGPNGLQIFRLEVKFAPVPIEWN
jgi:hypothetical protein